MAFQGYILLRMFLIAICLDISSIVLASVVAWDSKTPRYDNYNLDKGPVIYEAYYPDARESYQKKRYFDRNTVLETSFQVPFDRFIYSTEISNHPTWNESSIVASDEKKLPSKEQWKAIKTRHNYNFTNEFVPFYNERFSATFDKDKNIQNMNIKKISKLVRRAISQDLESWNALERYLERTSNQAQPILQQEMYLQKNRENEKDYNYPFQVNQRTFDPSERLNSKILRKLEMRNVQQSQPTYLEEVDARKNTMQDKTVVNNKQVADRPSVNIISDSSAENIFQPRPQLIRYTFFRKFTPQLNERIEKMTDKSILRNYSDNLIRKEIAEDSYDKQVKENNIKITSIEVSKLPRHKIRHHHDKWPKRHYFTHRHRSQSTIYPIN